MSKTPVRRVFPSGTVEDLVKQQTTHLLREARRIDEKGYAVFIHHLNSDGATSHLYRYFSGAFDNFLDDIRQHPIIVHVWPDVTKLPDILRTGRVFDYPLRFKCILPRIRRILPIVAAVELMGTTTTTARKDTGYKRRIQGAGTLFEVRSCSSSSAVTGSSKDALLALLRVLDMPHHRAVLTGRDIPDHAKP